jgi:tRNA-Thr(GGU) m(6)t(6)A37 methyltransferase TsaA
MTPAPSGESLTLRPIGVLHTPYSDRFRAPRQPSMAETGCESTLVLHPNQNFEQAVEDLGGFDMIWLIVWLHRNKTWKPKVLPPRGPRKKRSVFATRSPHRPNPIGLSTARLLSIKGRTLQLGATDLLDGTPILDIKPYLPYADSFPDARAGWLDDVAAAEARAKAECRSYTVDWSELAAKQAEWLAQKHGIELADETRRILRQDPTPHPYRRISRWSRTHLILAIKSWRVKFTVLDERVYVERIVSGYSISALTHATMTQQQLHDQRAHDDFHRAWPQLPE